MLVPLGKRKRTWIGKIEGGNSRPPESRKCQRKTFSSLNGLYVSMRKRSEPTGKEGKPLLNVIQEGLACATEIGKTTQSEGNVIHTLATEKKNEGS